MRMPGRLSQEWSAQVPPATRRTWLGPGLYACRLQDWRLAEGRIECLEGAANKPIRVVHSLRATLGSQTASFEAEVIVAPGDGSPTNPGASCAGLLLGAGGEAIPYQLSALCHTRPAPDGGLAVGVDAAGRVVFRDNETNHTPGNWSVGGRLKEGEFETLTAAERSDPVRGRPMPETFRLHLTAQPEGVAYTLLVEVFDATRGELWSSATLQGVTPALVEGNLSIFSHLSANAQGTGWSFRGWRAWGEKILLHTERDFGPVLATQFTVHNRTLKLTAQMPPLGDDDASAAHLATLENGEWCTRASAQLEEDAYVFAFRVEDWDSSRVCEYRVTYDLRLGPEQTTECHWQGTIPREPGPSEPLVVAAFTGNKHFTGGIRWNSEGVWFPHLDIVRAVRHHDPDLLFFSGDQIYEGDLTGAQRRPAHKARLDYLDKWYRWCWAFGDLTRDRPTISIPDDHDIYQGNLWGAGGRAAQHQDDGGYTMEARFVRMVERTQTSHLPDPFDPTPVEQGIGVYYTSLDYGGVSFAIIEDRKFKSSATPLVPAGKCVNGWFQSEDFDPSTESDVAGAVLLGERQLTFLEAWALDWPPEVWLKCVLSQTIFTNLATLPQAAKSGSVLPGLLTLPLGEYAKGDRLAADTDSGGWPSSGRDRAVTRMRRAFAFHIAGDQHLGSLSRYGIEEFDDAGFAFCVPSIANTWPRRWFPPQAGLDREPGAPRYTGCFHDGFGNRVRVLAVSNPRQSGQEPTALHDRAPGYGIVRFFKQTQQITVECWPRSSDPTDPAAPQYAGWPRTLLPMAPRKGSLFLPPVEVSGLSDPLVHITREGPQGLLEVLYTRRVHGSRMELAVDRPGSYNLRIGPAAEGAHAWLRNLTAGPRGAPLRRVEIP